MGKRKKASKPPPKAKRGGLATTFACLFCNHENSVNVKIEKKLGVGNLGCKVCGVAFQAPVNYLSAAVDVYAAWVDACEDAAENARKGIEPQAVSQPMPSLRDTDAPAKRQARVVGGDEDEGGGYEADDFVVDDEEDGGRDYEDLDDDE